MIIFERFSNLKYSMKTGTSGACEILHKYSRRKQRMYCEYIRQQEHEYKIYDQIVLKEYTDLFK